MVNDHGQSELEDYFRDHGMEYDGMGSQNFRQLQQFPFKGSSFEAVAFCCQISRLVCRWTPLQNFGGHPNKSERRDGRV